MEFLVLSRAQIESGEHIPADLRHIIISITNPIVNEESMILWPPAAIPDNPNCHGILRLTFWDADRKKNGLDEIFTNDHATQILRFVKRHKDIDLIVAQCEAGRSRSAGTIASLTKLHGQDDNKWFKMKTPNMLVYRTILNMAHKMKMDFSDRN